MFGIFSITPIHPEEELAFVPRLIFSQRFGIPASVCREEKTVVAREIEFQSNKFVPSAAKSFSVFFQVLNDALDDLTFRPLPSQGQVVQNLLDYQKLSFVVSP